PRHLTHHHSTFTLMLLHFMSSSRYLSSLLSFFFFFFHDPPPTEIYTLSLHDALPISPPPASSSLGGDLFRSCGAPQRQPDRQHQQRGDFVHRHRLEHRVAHLEPLHRARDLDRHFEPAPERLVQPRNPRSAADRVHPPQAARRARGGREKRGGPLHPDGDLLAPRLHVWRQVATVRQALNHPLGVFRRQPLLALQVLAETARAHRQVP